MSANTSSGVLLRGTITKQYIYLLGLSLSINARAFYSKVTQDVKTQKSRFLRCTHLPYCGQLPHGLFFLEHLLDDFGFELCRILLPRLFLHELIYTLQANLLFSIS